MIDARDSNDRGEGWLFAAFIVGYAAALIAAAIVVLTLTIWAWNIAVAITGGPHV